MGGLLILGAATFLFFAVIIWWSMGRLALMQEVAAELGLEYLGENENQPVISGIYLGVPVEAWLPEKSRGVGNDLSVEVELNAEAPLNFSVTPKRLSREAAVEEIESAEEALKALEAHFSIQVEDRRELEKWLERREIARLLIEAKDSIPGFRIEMGRVKANAQPRGKQGLESILDRLVPLMKGLGFAPRRSPGAQGIKGIPRELFQARRGFHPPTGEEDRERKRAPVRRERQPEKAENIAPGRVERSETVEEGVGDGEEW